MDTHKEKGRPGMIDRRTGWDRTDQQKQQQHSELAIDDSHQRLLPLDPPNSSSATMLDNAYQKKQHPPEAAATTKQKAKNPFLFCSDGKSKQGNASAATTSKESSTRRSTTRVSFVDAEEKKMDDSSNLANGGSTSNNGYNNNPNLSRRNSSGTQKRQGKENTSTGKNNTATATSRFGIGKAGGATTNEEQQQQQQQQASKGGGRNLLGSIGKRLSDRFIGDLNSRRVGFVKVPSDNNDSSFNLGSENTNGNNNYKKKKFRKGKNISSLDQEEEQDEHDPVIKIFQARSTQRVRFSLEGRGGESSAQPQGNSSADAPASAGFLTTHTTSTSDDGQERKAAINIKQFMAKALFGSNKTSKKLNEEMQREVERELGNNASSANGDLVWESATTPTGPEVIHTNNAGGDSNLLLSFTEDSKARAQVVRLLNRARRAEYIHFRYEYAVKCYVRALNILASAKYPDDHPTVQKTMRLLNNSHHVLSSYNNSANIVKMGIKYEDAGELVRALKMYTIAYRIRRDNLNRNHPSLAVLLNMLGSIQIKRGELKEAMQIYELALKDAPVIFNADDDEDGGPSSRKSAGNLLAKSVTYREMGTIYEQWGNVDEALNMYHKSLESVSDWKEAANLKKISADDSSTEKHDETESTEEKPPNSNAAGFKLGTVLLARSTVAKNKDESDSAINEQCEMELTIGPEDSSTSDANGGATVTKRHNIYESYFPRSLEQEIVSQKDSNIQNSRDAYADMDLALTLHQIAQLHRCQGQYEQSLDAYEVALRGMKYALGKHHPNVAAVLGNIGNLQKEMGGMDAAYNTYQEVLGIESYRLGLSHPDVAITLHNIATIDAARGNYEQSLSLYKKVLGLQKKLFGEDHLSVSVTAACMGDVYERVGNLDKAVETFQEAVRIKSTALGRHSLEVSRLLHKLGKLAARQSDYHMAGSFISRAVLIYRLNKLTDEHEWIIDAYRDTADIDAAIAMGGGRQFEC